MKQHDAFISFAFEDEKFATELSGSLISNGFNIWYAPFNVLIGDSLLKSIENGISNSFSGILIISQSYLKKDWTSFEMETILRLKVDNKIELLPIWHNVTKQEIEQKHSSLGNIFALNSNIGLRNLSIKLTKVLSKNASTICYIPSYEDYNFQFFRGNREILLRGEDGPATTIWELLLSEKDSLFPIYLNHQKFTKEDLLLECALVINHFPESVERVIGEEGRLALIEMCKKAGVDPDKLS